METHLTLHRRIHKYDIALVDQGGIRPTFGSVLMYGW